MTPEREVHLVPGGPALLGMAAALGVLILLCVVSAATNFGALWFLIVPGFIALFVLPFGLIANGPNETRVIQLFGAYVGTLKTTGFFYGNPFYTRTRVSLRARTFETGVETSAEVKDATGKVTSPKTERRHPSKVNDRDGTPIEVAAVVVWKVVNPTDAVFAVDSYVDFVRIQSEAALRNLVSRYSYDGKADEKTLHGNTPEIGDELRNELHERFTRAGVEVVESRISYLAYAPEIAAAMLQRQQAAATVAARAIIVEAAVGMVQHALDELSKRGVVELDADRKAAMVSNLLVVLCGHVNPTPVLNAGTLHN